ncbi:hypothetical protein [Kutzneria sp. 744]|uniref:hypothetical protein n=1 Tax=Kutzneria sp. (strain 744) TaxID=345341 RepID=UPI0003EEA6F0|nr:hypothetical protein [Kutzneria sp. 744]EWM19661.1 hypothetical protein KUTG_09965 [Kutzneria sp. 744]
MTRAQREVIAAAVTAERDEAYRIAKGSPAGLAALALVVRDLITDASCQLLLQPWEQLLGGPLLGSTTSNPFSS